MFIIVNLKFILFLENREKKRESKKNVESCYYGEKN